MKMISYMVNILIYHFKQILLFGYIDITKYISVGVVIDNSYELIQYQQWVPEIRLIMKYSRQMSNKTTTLANRNVRLSCELKER